MNKIVVLILGLCSLSNSSFSQYSIENIDVEWGDQFNESKKSTPSSVVGYDESGFYVVSKKHSMGAAYSADKVVISHFGRNAMLLKEEELVLKLGKNDMDYEFLIQLNGEFYIFSSFINKKEKKKSLYVQTMNKNTLQIDSESKIIAEASFMRNTESWKAEFEFSWSKDSTKFIVYNRILSKDEDLSKYRYHIFDNEMNELWTREIDFPYTYSNFYIKDFVLDDFGNPHFLIKNVVIKKSSGKNKEYDHVYYVSSHYTDRTKDNVVEIDKNGEYIENIHLEINPSEELVISGFYSDPIADSGEGFFYIIMDIDTKNVLVDNFIDFDQDFIKKNRIAYAVKKTDENPDGVDYILYDFHIDEIVYNDNGNVTIIGEQSYYTNYESVNNGYKDITYYNGNIIIVKIESGGNILWMETIKKFQKIDNSNKSYSSYASSTIGNNSYFIFNDSPNNLENYKYESYTKSNSQIIIVEIDSDGKQNKSVLFNTDGDVVLTKPKLFEQISNDEFVLYLENGDLEHFSKVTFK